MLSRNVAKRARSAKDPAAPFRDLGPTFAAADIAFVNLESPFSDRGPVMQRGMIFKAEPEMIEGLKLAGIDIVSTANNHARDQRGYGLEFTLDWLEKNDIAAVGSGDTEEIAHAGVVLERNGVRFGFLAYTYDANNGNYRDTDARIAVMNEARMVEDIARLREKADVVLVSMHAGIEYRKEPNQQQRSFARAAIDAGAKVVVGHHPHVRQPWESYKDGVIFYSLGNLVFDQFQRVETQLGDLALVEFEGPALVRTELLPVTIDRTVPRLTVPEAGETAASAASAAK